MPGHQAVKIKTYTHTIEYTGVDHQPAQAPCNPYDRADLLTKSKCVLLLYACNNPEEVHTT
jgi:hypothetical protein